MDGQSFINTYELWNLRLSLPPILALQKYTFFTLSARYFCGITKLPLEIPRKYLSHTLKDMYFRAGEFENNQHFTWANDDRHHVASLNIIKLVKLNIKCIPRIAADNPYLTNTVYWYQQRNVSKQNSIHCFDHCTEINSDLILRYFVFFSIMWKEI